MNKYTQGNLKETSEDLNKKQILYGHENEDPTSHSGMKDMLSVY